MMDKRGSGTHDDRALSGGRPVTWPLSPRCSAHALRESGSQREHAGPGEARNKRLPQQPATLAHSTVFRHESKASGPEEAHTVVLDPLRL